jgi:GNAT superfamily N-acetyltransferase
MVRKAVVEDLRKIVEMSEKFYHYTSYWTRSRIPFDPQHVAFIAISLMENSIMHVVESDGVVVGMVGVIFIPFLFNPQYIHAGEIIWWVEPEHMSHGYGRALLRSIEDPCREAGVRHVQMLLMAESPEAARFLYESEGYILSEHSFTKVL